MKNNLRSIFFLPVLVMFVLACGHREKKETASISGYFEGYIDYNVEFKSFIPQMSSEMMKKLYGGYLRIYYKDGNYKWVFTDKKGLVISYTTTLQKEAMEYHWYIDRPDTLEVEDKSLIGSTHITEFTEDGKDTVLDCSCTVAKISGTRYHKDPPDSVPAYFRYSFCPTLRIDPAHYEKFRNFKWNEITKKYKSIAIKMVSTYKDLMSATFTAVEIKHEPVDMAIFDIDKTKIIKTRSED